jgi:hypothetical protein
MKLNKIPTQDALSLTKPSYAIPPELEAAWLGYKHSIGSLTDEAEKTTKEVFWKDVVKEVEAGLGLVKPWKRSDGDVDAEEVEGLVKGHGHGVPLSGTSSTATYHLPSPELTSTPAHVATSVRSQTTPTSNTTPRSRLETRLRRSRSSWIPVVPTCGSLVNRVEVSLVS